MTILGKGKIDAMFRRNQQRAYEKGDYRSGHQEPVSPMKRVSSNLLSRNRNDRLNTNILTRSLSLSKANNSNSSRTRLQKQ